MDRSSSVRGDTTGKEYRNVHDEKEWTIYHVVGIWVRRFRARATLFAANVTRHTYLRLDGHVTKRLMHRDPVLLRKPRRTNREDRGCLVQFQQQLVTEITAPNNVPFLPGNNVTGFGSQVPAELVAAGFANAIVFYASDWNPAATTRKVKFRFIAASSVGLVIGYGYALNPSVDQTAFVVKSQVFTISPFTDGNSTKFLNNTSDEVFEFTEAEYTAPGGSGLARWPQLLMSAPGGGVPGGETLAQLTCTNAIEELQFQSGSSLAQLVHTRGDNFMWTPQWIAGDRLWQAFTLFNGWTGHANSPPQYRMMPDGTVIFRGILTKVGNPANGEQWGSVAAGYAPPVVSRFLCPPEFRAYNGAQTANVNTNGTCTIFDMPALAGDLVIDSIRYAVKPT